MKRILTILFISLSFVVSAQQPINIKELSREEILNLSYEQLLELSMEDIVYLTQKMGVSMDDLLSMKLSVSSKSKTTLREQPGIITVYTAEDIDRMGIRDFTDLLRLVPGYNINFDSQGVLGASSRGIWGFEGKILFLVDGIEMNDLLYATTAIGNRFPISQIKRVEIIRGPGSSIYGGSAELGVVNITTKAGEDINGIGACFSTGYMTETLGHYGGGIQLGSKKNDIEYSILANHILQNRSESHYADFYGFDGVIRDTLAEITNSNLNIGFKYKDLKAKFIYDDYKTIAIFGNGESFPELFKLITGELKYDYKPNSKLTITPKLNYIQSIPWDNGNSNEDRQIDRYIGNLTGIYDFNANINIVAGGEYFYDYSRYLDGSLFYNGNDNITFQNTAFFGQGIFKTKFVNIVVGTRFEMHSFYGNAIAPRIGFNKTYGNFHYKLLYSKAFRSPSTGNITTCDTLKKYNASIKPEKTDVAELELGYRIGKNNYLTVNFFNININEPITWYDYYEDSIYYQNQWFYNYNHWGYENMGKTGSRGVELDFQSKYRKYMNSFSYSFYTSKNINEIETFQVENKPAVLLGNPQHKVSYIGSFKIHPKISINPSLIWMSETNAYTAIDSVGDPILNKIDPTLLANLVVRFENLPIRNMHIDLGVYDILDQRYPYIQPYNGYYPPFPGPSREITFKLRYIFKFKE